MKYLVIGTDRKGKGFKFKTSNYIHAMGLNLYRGSVFILDATGRRIKLIRYVYN